MNCVLEENLGNVFDLLEKLQQMLMQKAVSSICDDSEVKPYLTDNDIVKMFKNHKVVSEVFHFQQTIVFENTLRDLFL